MRGTSGLCRTAARPNTRMTACELGHGQKVLKNDRRAIFTAAAHAQRAADFLHAFSHAAELEQEQQSEAAAFEKECGHLPGTMEKALPFYRDLIDRHHAAVLVADFDAVITLRKEASRLALKLNKGDPGILDGPDAPGCLLVARTATETGTIPKWGQIGSFMGLHAPLQSGFTPEVFAIEVINRHIETSLKGRLLAIEPKFTKE